MPCPHQSGCLPGLRECPSRLAGIPSGIPPARLLQGAAVGAAEQQGHRKHESGAAGGHGEWQCPLLQSSRDLRSPESGRAGGTGRKHEGMGCGIIQMRDECVRNWQRGWTWAVRSLSRRRCERMRALHCARQARAAAYIKPNHWQDSGRLKTAKSRGTFWKKCRP